MNWIPLVSRVGLVGRDSVLNLISVEWAQQFQSWRVVVLPSSSSGIKGAQSSARCMYSIRPWQNVAAFGQWEALGVWIWNCSSNSNVIFSCLSRLACWAMHCCPFIGSFRCGSPPTCWCPSIFRQEIDKWQVGPTIRTICNLNMIAYFCNCYILSALISCFSSTDCQRAVLNQ